MSHDDFDVVVYKVLAYLMACMREGVRPSAAKAQEVSGVNEYYWAEVVASMVDKGLVRGLESRFYMDGPAVVAAADFGITMDGAAYLRDNSAMQKAAHFLGSAFQTALPTLVEATRAIAGLA